MTFPRPNTCNLPETVEPQEAIIYKILLSSHCGDKRAPERCAGSITITRDAVTVQCPRCGDAKQKIEGGR